jgi:hypothetical protein
LSWRALLRRLDEPRDVKRALYRGHRIAGVALFGGALFALDRLWFAYEPGAVAGVLRSWGKGELDAVLVDSVWFFLVAGNVGALAAALVMVIRPSLLKGLERWADRSYGERNSS